MSRSNSSAKASLGDTRHYWRQLYRMRAQFAPGGIVMTHAGVTAR